MVKPIPDGYHSVTPYVVTKNASRVLEFVKQAFGAEEMFRMPGPDNTIRHAEFRVGDSIIMIADGGEEYPATPVNLMLYVPNVDEVYARALASGAKAERPVEDQFYGDRSGGVIDPGGNHWWIATHVEDVAPDEMARRAAARSKSAA